MTNHDLFCWRTLLFSHLSAVIFLSVLQIKSRALPTLGKASISELQTHIYLPCFSLKIKMSHRKSQISFRMVEWTFHIAYKSHRYSKSKTFGNNFHLLSKKFCKYSTTLLSSSSCIYIWHKCFRDTKQDTHYFQSTLRDGKTLVVTLQINNCVVVMYHQTIGQYRKISLPHLHNQHYTSLTKTDVDMIKQNTNG